MAKDASNFCSEWVSVSFFTLIVLLKVMPPKLDKGFVIGAYFGTGTFKCWGAMPRVKDAPNFCSVWVSASVFTLIVPLKVPPPKLEKGFVIGGYFGMGTFE